MVYWNCLEKDIPGRVTGINHKGGTKQMAASYDEVMKMDVKVFFQYVATIRYGYQDSS